MATLLTVHLRSERASKLIMDIAVPGTSIKEIMTQKIMIIYYKTLKTCYGK